MNGLTVIERDFMNDVSRIARALEEQNVLLAEIRDAIKESKKKVRE